jgi:hypothetical protein
MKDFSSKSFFLGEGFIRSIQLKGVFAAFHQFDRISVRIMDPALEIVVDPERNRPVKGNALPDQIRRHFKDVGHFDAKMLIGGRGGFGHHLSMSEEQFNELILRHLQVDDPGMAGIIRQGNFF